MRIDLKLFFATAFLFVSGIVAVNVLVDDSDSGLLRLQRSKLERSAEVLFVGDSSLGHSLDAARASELLQLRVLNLALTGSYGLSGSRWMIEHYLAGHRNVQAIYVVQTVDVFGREVDSATVDATLDRALDPRDAVNVLRAVRRAKLLVRGGKFDPTLDYPRQEGGILDADEVPALLRVSLSNSSVVELRRIGAACGRYRIKCYLALGPIAERQFPAARDFMHDGLPDVTGLQLLAESTPFAMGAEELGNSPDHVRPSRKLAFTEKWVAVVCGSLSPESPGCLRQAALQLQE